MSNNPNFSAAVKADAPRARRAARPATDRVVRIYEVTLWPLTSSGEPHSDGPFDPFTITLGYPADKLPSDPHGDEVKAEALRVALKHDGFSPEEMPKALAEYMLSDLRYKRSKFYPAAQTFEAGVARKAVTA